MTRQQQQYHTFIKSLLDSYTVKTTTTTTTKQFTCIALFIISEKNIKSWNGPMSRYNERAAYSRIGLLIQAHFTNILFVFAQFCPTATTRTCIKHTHCIILENHLTPLTLAYLLVKLTLLTARHTASYAKRCISYDRFYPTVRPSDRPSDRLSQSGIMRKRLQLRSCGLHWRIAP